MPNPKKKEIITVNVTRLKEELTDKLDAIDANTESSIYKGYYESRLRVEMAMWRKGKAIDVFFRGVENTSYYQLEKNTGRRRANLEIWRKLYLKYPDMDNYKRIAIEKAQEWTVKTYDKMRALAEDKKRKQLPESKMKSYIKGITNLLDDDFGFTDELDELYKRLCKKYKKKRK